MVKHVVITAGGTGGHVFPGLAMAEALQKKGYKVSWLGSTIGMERELIADRVSFYSLPVYQLRRKGLKAWLLFPWRVGRAVIQALALFKKIKPDVVVALGGFVSGPGGIAAWFSHIPLVIHEQNARAGLTNRLLARIATTTLQAFPDVFSKKIHAVTVGNPVRESISGLPAPEKRLADHKAPLRILILGGSLGAATLNDRIMTWLHDFPFLEKITLKHQTGKAHIEVMRSAYQQLPVLAEVSAFIDDMATAWNWADVVICRAGALTVSEVAAVGVAAIFVPLPHAVDNHQWHNANYLAAHGSSIIIEQDNLVPHILSPLIVSFLNDPSKALTISQLARAQSASEATRVCVSMIEELL